MKIEDLDFSTIEIIEPRPIAVDRECELEVYRDIKKYIPYLRAYGKISTIAENKILERLNEELK